MDTIVIDKFWEAVEKTKSCWNWIGFLDKSGLPIIRVVVSGKLKEYSSRRISLFIDGKDVSSSKQVQPLICKNKLCVNPSHLVMGDAARFWAKVQRLGDDDCWIWIAGQDKDMYGKFLVNKVQIRAHVYSWQLYTGRPVPPGIQVCHKCDHPYCVNPHHLFLGTNRDNTQDRHEKGRDAKGESHGNSKLTEEQVKEIRELYQSGKTITQLSRLYTTMRSNILAIVKRKQWAHI